MLLWSGSRLHSKCCTYALIQHVSENNNSRLLQFVIVYLEFCVSSLPVKGGFKGCLPYFCKDRAPDHVLTWVCGCPDAAAFLLKKCLCPVLLKIRHDSVIPFAPYSFRVRIRIRVRITIRIRIRVGDKG